MRYVSVPALMAVVVVVLLAPGASAIGVTDPAPAFFTLNPGESGAFQIQIQTDEFGAECAVQLQGQSDLILNIPQLFEVDDSSTVTVDGSVQVPGNLAPGIQTVQFCVLAETDGGAFDFCGLTLTVQVNAEPEAVFSFDFVPNTLNLGSQGQVVTGFLEPPPPMQVADIDISTLRLGGVVEPQQPIRVGDHDEDGIEDLMMKFDRAEVITTVQSADPSSEIVITGEIAGEPFEAMDYARTIWVGDQLVPPGGALDFSATATALESTFPGLDYDVLNLPAGSSFDSGTQEFSWATSQEDAGAYPDVLFVVRGPGFDIVDSIIIYVGTVPVEISVFTAD